MTTRRNLAREEGLTMPATAVGPRPSAQRRGVIINLRASAHLRDLFDRAAALLGQN